MDQLGVVLPYIKKQELADAMMLLAVAHTQKGLRSKANGDLIRLLTWRPDYQPEGIDVPAALLAQIDEARRAVGKLRRGEVLVQSEPPGAQVFFDGRYVGVTPIKVADQVVGDHYVVLRKLGYKKGLRIAGVEGKPTTVQARLVSSEKYLLVRQATAQLAPHLGDERLDKTLSVLRDGLFLDHAIFVRISPEPEGRLRLLGYVYDLRSRSLLRSHGQVVARSEGEEAERQMTKLADGLYQGVDYSGLLQAPPAPPPKVAERRLPVYKRWWFWTAAGAIVAGGAAVAIGVSATRSPGCPSGNGCFGIEF